MSLTARSLLLVGTILLAAYGCDAGPKPSAAQATSRSASDNDLINPSHPESGTIGENVTKLTTVEKIPSKPWALMGWSQATQLTGNKRLWMAFDYYHSELECAAARNSNIDNDKGTDLETADLTSKCVRIGPTIPLNWRMIAWNDETQKWVEVSRYTSKAECDVQFNFDRSQTGSLQEQCLPVAVKTDGTTDQ